MSDHAPCKRCEKREARTRGGLCWECLDAVVQKVKIRPKDGPHSTHARGSSEADGDNPWGDYATRCLEESR